MRLLCFAGTTYEARCSVVKEPVATGPRSRITSTSALWRHLSVGNIGADWWQNLSVVALSAKLTLWKSSEQKAVPKMGVLAVVRVGVEHSQD